MVRWAQDGTTALGGLDILSQYNRVIAGQYASVMSVSALSASAAGLTTSMLTYVKACRPVTDY